MGLYKHNNKLLPKVLWIDITIAKYTRKYFYDGTLRTLIFVFQLAIEFGCECEF